MRVFLKIWHHRFCRFITSVFCLLHSNLGHWLLNHKGQSGLREGVYLFFSVALCALSSPTMETLLIFPRITSTSCSQWNSCYGWHFSWFIYFSFDAHFFTFSNSNWQAKRLVWQSKIKTKKIQAKVHQGQAEGKVQKQSQFATKII